MSVSELSKYIFASKYARWIPEKKRRENWQETVLRIKSMMIEKYKEKIGSDKSILDDIEWAYSLMNDKWLVGSQRTTQFAGPAIFKHFLRGYNCSATYVDRLRVFQEIMYVLLAGCGAGFSVQRHHVEKLPEFSSRTNLNSKVYVIPDSIEGWSDSIGILLSSYFNDPIFPEYSNAKIVFDFSQIRPKGSPISSCNGKAPGPEPLRKALENITKLLDRCIKDGQSKLRPIDAHDLICHIADSVLSGGVRRAALISLFSIDDEEMIKCKTGSWFYDNPQRGRANNSAVALRKNTSFAQFNNLIHYTKEYGDPGIYWVNSLEECGNPCLEISLFPIKENTNETGWQTCNLSSINGKKVKTREEFLDCCKAAAIIGTLQAGFDEFPYLGNVSEDIIKREALLGVSICGMMDSPEILLNAEIQREGAQLVVKTNEKFAKKLGINPASRCTTVKPDGTVSLLFKSASGIHPNHARRYFRRVQANKLESIYQHFKKTNNLACEKCTNTNNDDEAITFCIEVEKGAKLKNDVNAIQLLDAVKLTKENWIESGTNKKYLVNKNLRHNVSNTITVKEDEWEKVTKYIYENRYSLGGISLLSDSGDLDYPMAPFTAIHTPKEILEKYGESSLFVSGLIVKALEIYDNNLWKACDAALGIGESLQDLKTKKFKFQLQTPLDEIEFYRNNTITEITAKSLDEYDNIRAKIDWLCDMEKFAGRYLEGNIRKLTYLMKEVHNWKYWLDLQREYKKVNYEECIEECDNTKFSEEIACSGGSCEIIRT